MGVSNRNNFADFKSVVVTKNVITTVTWITEIVFLSTNMQ